MVLFALRSASRQKEINWRAKMLSPHSFFFFSTSSFVRLRPPSRAQCEIAAPELHEEALRLPGGSQG
eukprot:8581656-Pyramimonas_sp.AAC.1